MINIVDKKDCCGCEACFNICPQKCIKMISDEEGFLYPEVSQQSCINCGACEQVCPIKNYIPREKNDEQEAFILQHKNKEICRQSTSGGAFTGIATYVIEHGGIVFGVEMTEAYLVRHTVAETIDDLQKFRNSKYVQSRIGYVYQQVKEALINDRIVCFSGTPCQIEGLRHYLRKNYDNLVLVDVVCRAVPSPGIWEKYIHYESNIKGEISSIKFRDKTLGYQFSTMELRDKDGKVYRGGIESQPWLRMFFSGMINRPSCSNCKFRNRYRNSDLTIWDCFNSYKFDKKLDENRGTTRVLTHSEKGKKILDEIENRCIIKKINADEAVNNVKEMKSSPIENANKNIFFDIVNNESFEKALNIFFKKDIKAYIKYYARRVLNFFKIDVYIKRLLKR